MDNKEDDGFVNYEEISKPISKAEYKLLIERWKRKGMIPEHNNNVRTKFKLQINKLIERFKTRQVKEPILNITCEGCASYKGEPQDCIYALGCGPEKSLYMPKD